MTFQQISLIGNAGRDAELRYTPNGKAVADFSLATTDSYNDETTWWKVTMWGPLAENVAKYIKKGKQVFVTGTMTHVEPNIWTPDDGVPRAQYEITVRELKLLGGRQQDAGNAGTPPVSDRPTTEGSGSTNPTKQDEIPF